MQKIWYLKHPISKYYDGDIKAKAKEAGAKIIDFKFSNGNANDSDCPKEKNSETTKKRGRKKKEVKENND